jgi:amidophosphoribosyltransferase
MSDAIQHECGIALVRLLKPLQYYYDKYGTALYGLNKMYLLMEKQNNRGQDGAGLATIKFDIPPGDRYISRHRSANAKAVPEIFEHVLSRFNDLAQINPDKLKDANWLKFNMPYIAEVMLGHLRYGTFGKNSIESCHPFLRQNNWMTRNLVIAGNFNMTNVEELIDQLLELGQHPKEKADTITVLEKIGHFLDEENQALFDYYKSLGHNNVEITHLIAENLDLAKILINSAKKWDGGYAIAGLLGHGDAFVLRDPAGIRPAYYYKDDEVVVVTSERPAIQTAFNVPYDKIQEIQPGHALIIRKNGTVVENEIRHATAKKSCSFERIYFSRGSDAEIYQERKNLGRLLTPQILEEINSDFENTVFSYIPNTAEVAFFGMSDAIEDAVRKVQKEKIKDLGTHPKDADLDAIMNMRPRIEKVPLKDAKLRTFITQDSDRNEMVSHVYDTTYGVVEPGKDTLVVIDDSIVRGTTLKQSILKILDRLGPKKIVIVSSAPQIRYPDCYGIDMSRMGEFVAFQAAIALLKEHKKEHIIQEVYEACKAELTKPDAEQVNQVKRIYETFEYQAVSDKIAQIIRPEEIQAEVKVIYQTIDNLHRACPNHKGDWYFSGDFPTPGGNRVVNKAYINFVEGKNARAY